MKYATNIHFVDGLYLCSRISKQNGLPGGPGYITRIAMYYDDDYEQPTYERYNGSYAQDVEGWSDQDIDDVFDGEPDAYWNID